ncbi:MAG TPA: hypothetical protein VGY57_11570, partial [Vicinamibacterales bacterium]|nr:hypothetical protein [Vicinamibacterales bacterium]
GLNMSRVFRVSTGIDQTLTPMLRVSFGYMAVRGIDVLHGVNVNAPDPTLGGLRPDPRFANVIALASDANTHTNQFNATMNVNLSPGRPPSNPPRWNWRRTNLRFNYWLAEINNNSDGPFSVSPTGTLTTEWGPAANDRRHRVAAQINTQVLRDLNATLSLATISGLPYTITTGFDGNGDSIFNDRPLGVGRNTARTDSQVTWNLNASYTLRMGARRPSAMQDGQRERDRAGDAQAANANRYRLTFTVNLTNLTNRSNFTGYSGVMTSPFFEQPTAVLNPRKVDIGMTFGF